MRKNLAKKENKEKLLKYKPKSLNETENKTNVLLTEYTALREEILQNLNHQKSLFVWIGAAIYAIFAFVITNSETFPEIKLLFIFFPFIIFTWLGFNIKVYFKVHQIGSYLDLIENKIDFLLNTSLMKWEKIADLSFRQLKNYKSFASFYINFFIILPFLFIFVYSLIGGYNYLEQLESLKNHCLIAKLFLFCVPAFGIILIICIILYYKININWEKEFCNVELNKFKEIEKFKNANKSGSQRP